MLNSLGGSNPVADYLTAQSTQTQMTAQFQRTPAYSQAVAYYQANIGSVTSVDGLLKNYKLLQVALGAFNLSGAINQTGLLKQLLTQDPTAKTSLAQKMLDPRYMGFAKAFWSLSTDGGVSTSNPINVDSVLAKYTNYKYQAWVGQTQKDPSVRQALYAQNSIQDAVDISNVGSLFTQFQNASDTQAAVNYYQTHIVNVTTVSQFTSDPQLVNFALTSYGIDPASVSADTLNKLMTQSPSDPASVAANNPAYQKFAQGFSTLNSDKGATVQSSASIAAVVSNYQNFAFQNTVSSGNSTTLTRVFGANGAKQIATLRQDFNTSSGVTQSAANYTANIGNVTSGTDLSKNQGLLNVALLAYNLDPSQLPSSGIASAASYYKAHIGAVTTVAKFTADQQLVNVALTAFGINPAAVGSVQLNRLLTENPTSSTSLAQTNPQYLAFAQAFQSLNSMSGVWIHSKNAIDSVVNAYQTDAMQTTISTQLTQQQAGSILQAGSYYQANIGNVTSPSQLITDPKLLSVALTAFGIDPNSTSNATVSQLLTQDPAAAGSLAQTKPEYLAFAQAFASLNPSVSNPATGAAIHSKDSIDSVLVAFQKNELTAESLTLPNTQQASAIAQTITYYQNNIGGVTSPATLQADSQLTNMALLAYGINPSSVSSTQINQLLTQNPATAGSLAQTDSQYMAFANAFSTLQSDNGTAIHSAASVSTVIQKYEAAILEPQNATLSASAYYQANIGKVTDDNQFLGDQQLITVALTAYGINPANVSAAQVQTLLTQDPTASTSLAQTDAQYLAFANAFASLATDGGAAIQSQASIDTVLVKYQNSALQTTSGTPAGSQAPTPLANLFTQFQSSPTTQQSIAYYKSHITGVTSVAQFAADPNLVDFALQAYGIDPTTVDSAQINQLLTQDPTSAKSLALQNPKYLAFAQAFASLNKDNGATIQGSASINTVVATYQNAAFMAALTSNTTSANSQIFDTTNVQQIGMLRDDLLTTTPLNQLLTQNPNDPLSLAQQNPEFTTFAQTFASSTAASLTALHNAGNVSAVVTKFQNNEFRAVVGADLAQSQAAKQAYASAYPHANASKGAPPITINQVLSDPTISAVVRDAYGMPASEAALSVTQQTAALTSAGFDPYKLLQPGAIDKLVKQFLANAAVKQSDTANSSGDSLGALLFPADSDSTPLNLASLITPVNSDSDSDSTAPNYSLLI